MKAKRYNKSLIPNGVDRWCYDADVREIEDQLEYVDSLLKIQEEIIDRLKKEIGDFRERDSDINRDLASRISW